MSAVRVREMPGGGLSIAARERPFAAWAGLALLAPGLALAGWGAAGGHAIEATGGVVLILAGALLVQIGVRGLRTIELTPGERITIRCGTGPLRQQVEHALGDAPRVRVEPFELPDGAPDLPDRGGDLVLEDGDARVHLVRLTGGATRELGPLRDRLDALLRA